jgi:predicted Rossmann fold nucleotide-binding protein DprA/Smf involved in DNA uptake
VDRVFQASLTELEASGLPVQSAQALATGRSVDLANEEIARATAADVHLVAFDDPAYPARLLQFTIRRWCCMFAEIRRCCRCPALPL